MMRSVHLGLALAAAVAAAGARADFDHGALRQEFEAADAADGAVDGQAQHLTASVCGRCHPARLDELVGSVHHTFRSANPLIQFPGGGQHGHTDRASGITGGSTAVNYLFDDERGCGRCHVGKYLPGSLGELELATGRPTPAMALVRDGVDCLVCHAAQYDGRDRIVTETAEDGQPRRVWRQDRSWAAVASLGEPRTAACLRCHREAASPDERGTPFEAWNDVHLASSEFRANACTRCHEVEDHRFPRGNAVSELFAADYPVGSARNAVSCERCHDAGPHRSARLNGHAAFIACQTCHIPWTSGLTYARWERDGRRAAFARADANSAQDTRAYEVHGLTQAEAWTRYRMRPRYLWFDGSASFLAQPAGRRGDGKSKIWPFKPLTSGLPMDVSGLSMADLLDDATVQRALVGTGAMIPGDAPQATAGAGMGTLGNRTADSSLTVEVQRAMAATPMSLDIDLGVAAGARSLGAGIAAAMQRKVFTLDWLGRALGAPEDSPLLSIFDGAYPGERYAVVDVPTGENMQPALGPTYPAGAYLTLTHGVRPAREALSCRDCHGGAAGVLERNALKVVVGRDTSGAPVYREANNSEVLGYGPTGLRR